MTFIIMYNYATVIDILQARCHYIILQVLVWKWYRLNTATCKAFGVFSSLICDFLSLFFILCVIRYMVIYI